MIYIEANSHESAFVELLKKLDIEANYSRDPELLIEDQLAFMIDGKKPNSSATIFTGSDFEIPEAVQKHFDPGILKEVKAHYLGLLDHGSEIEWIIDYLKSNQFSKRAIINFWKKSDTDVSHKCPCVVYFLFRVTKNGLDMSVHMRSNDVNRKMLLNLHLFSAIQKYVAAALGEKVGHYYHFVDTVIIHKVDQEKFAKIQKEATTSEDFFRGY
ncbi:MAG TPA: thymidylate synthase [Candidatus Saccharimonadales bacterium]|nr:thymidylate synthase [Candidatus Saccharimonadales bacterium]